MKIKIGDRLVGDGEKTYVIAEIGSNFDGSIERAKKLIRLAKECGADCAKFQSFKTNKIICPEGFKNSVSFQSKWKRSVADVYKAAEFPREWHKELAEYCNEIGIHFSSAPYDKEAVDLLDEIGLPFFKVGSGDITFHQLLRHIARKGKPVILSTGASTMEEIEEAVNVIKSEGNENIILLQCVTNYPSPIEDANVRVLDALKDKFNLLVGYSDHTLGSIVPLASVALGSCVIEKHFTDDKTREGPDHPHAIEPNGLKKMIEDIRLVEKSLGSPEKKVYPSESETVIIQRRCIHAAKDISLGSEIKEDDLDILRPAPKGAFLPKDFDSLMGKKAKRDIKCGDSISPDDIG